MIMIAPVRPPETGACRVGRRWRQARGFVAATLLNQPQAPTGPPIAAWKAWAFVGWLVLVTAVFGVSMLR